jgi:Bacterial protein of unknown function (DUF899)
VALRSRNWRRADRCRIVRAACGFYVRWTSYLDMTAMGRQEEWEDSPESYPPSKPYKWWNWNDSYALGAAPEPEWVEVSDAGVEAFCNRKG